MRISVIGSGSWGTALASVFARNGFETTLWSRDRQVVRNIQEQGCNEKYLPNTKVPQELNVTAELASAIHGAELIVFAVPSHALREVATASRSWLSESALVVHAAKGFDPTTRQRMSEVLEEVLHLDRRRIAVIGGPSHAEEVILSLPTTIVVSAYSRKTAEAVQDALMNANLRVYTNADVVGTEVGGALKNIVGLGVGIAVGLGSGDNARAALMTRGLAEIARLGVALGGSMLTFTGLAGVGDLFVTCTSMLSRNFRAGKLLGEGYSLDETLERIGMVVEGVRATELALSLAKDYQASMPITEALYRILFEGSKPEEAVLSLMTRAKNHEVEDIAVGDVSARWMFL